MAAAGIVADGLKDSYGHFRGICVDFTVPEVPFVTQRGGTRQSGAG